MSRRQKDKQFLIPHRALEIKAQTEYDESTQITINSPLAKDSRNPKYVNLLQSQNAEKYSARPPFWQWVTFMDMLPYSRQINQDPEKFEMKDIPKPEFTYNIEGKLRQLEQEWQKESQKPNPSFLKALLRAFSKEAIQSLAIAFVENLSKILSSIYMGKVVSIVTASNQESKGLNSGELVNAAVVLSVLATISIFAKGRYFFTVGAYIGQLRLVIAAILYKKLNATSLTSLHEINIGRVINLVGNDLGDVYGLWWFPSVIITPLLIILGIYLMWGYFGPSCLVALISLVLITLCQSWLSDKTKSPADENKKTVDERVKYTHEIIESIRLIKMYTWEKIFKERILKLREKEHQTFVKIANINALGLNISNLAVYFSILVLCFVYIIFGGVLSSEKVYATIMVLTCLSTALSTSMQGKMGFVNFQLVVGRIEGLLGIKGDLAVEEDGDEEATQRTEETCTIGSTSVVFKDFTGYWNRNKEKACLSNIDLVFKHGTLTAVIGKIGSGKSTFLLSFLKELPVTDGILSFSGKIAYVEQDPVIFSGTFRENILFGREYDESLYRRVIADCNLLHDLERFSHGDQTRIGERGVNLSGGQKARISLARALYSQSEIYLLDDPFSALDSKVSRNIFDRVLKGEFLRSKTVILVTHHLHFAKEADQVLLFQDGRIEGKGTFEELEKLNNSLLSVFKTDSNEKEGKENQSEQDDKKKDSDNAVSKTEEKEALDKPAQVTMQTYLQYLKAQGSFSIFSFIFLAFLSTHGLILYFIKTAGHWAEDQNGFYQKGKTVEGFDSNSYLIKLLIILILIFLVNFIKTSNLYGYMLSTNSTIHRRMLDAILRARVVFFDTNPIGRILNRFSSDLGLIDKNTIKDTYEFLDNTMSYGILLGTVCYIIPGILILIGLVLYGLFKVKKFFRHSVVLARRYEVEAKTPVLSAIPATLQGLIVIRAYNQGARFIEEFKDKLYFHLRALMFVEKTIRLFNFVLDVLIAFFTVAGIWIFILLILYYNFQTGLLGLCLMSLLRIGDQGSILIRQTLWIELGMQAAQRMFDYCNLKEELPEHKEEEDEFVEKHFEGKWPTKGEIVCKNVFLKYREDLDFALKGLSVDIAGGTKIACVGRTGAGKSSIIQALFRLVETEKDGLITIDGVDISSIGLNLLRSKLAIIPQNPVVFAGTIKKNLDPFEKLSDEELWAILEDVGLKAHIWSLPDQLGTDMTVSSAVFSTGQKQLVCLARAIINQSKVIILDEATANVDVETDAFIQKTIMRKFKDCTVLTVAHRLITIANYDKVMVIDNGQVAEHNSPYELLVDRIGDNEITKQNGIFAEMVKSTGASMSKMIFDISRDHYLSNKEGN